MRGLVVWVWVAPVGAAVDWAGGIDPRGARAPSARCEPSERAPPAQSAAGRQPSDCRHRGDSAPREPSLATFDIQSATTLVQPQIDSLKGIALVLSLRNYSKLIVTTAFTYYLDFELTYFNKK